jgi:anti-sigma regulatory factor (Ser/Thr protein kinase)
MPQAIRFFSESLSPPLGAQGLRGLVDGLLKSALEAGLAKESAWRLAAAADELLSNLEEHGNANRLELSADLPQGHQPLRLRLLDNSRSFNLMRAVASAEEPDGWQERGLGLWMVRQAARSLSRERTPRGENETIVEF